MKICELKLIAFGPFTNVTLNLKDGDKGLHIIYGPNEAGKSSALRAITDTFYGIPTKSTDNFLHPNTTLRTGLTLEKTDGTQLNLVRRKGVKGTLLQADGTTQMDEALLRELFGGIDRNLFSSMFGINHEMLIRGGKQIVEGRGEVGHVLFAAGAGIANLQAVRSSLEKEAHALFKKQGSKPPINKSLNQLRQARKTVQEAQLPSSEWITLNKSINEIQKKLKELEEVSLNLSKKKERYDRIQTALPIIAKRRHAKSELDKLGNVLVIDADFTERRRDCLGKLLSAEEIKKRATKRFDATSKKIESLKIPLELIERADAIEDLRTKRDVCKKAIKDRPNLCAQRDQLNAQASDILRFLNPNSTTDDANSLEISPTMKVNIQDLGQQQGTLDSAVQQAQDRVDELNDIIAQNQANLKKLGRPSNPEPLKNGLKRVREYGDIQSQLMTAKSELEQLRQQIDTDLDSLQLWNGTVEELERLAIPTVETCDRFEMELAHADQNLSAKKKELADANDRLKDIDEQIDRKKLECDVPTENAIKEARKSRDLGWTLVVEAWTKDIIDPQKLERWLVQVNKELDLANNADLVRAYEETVRNADSLADRLRREADRVAVRAQLQAEKNAIERKIEEIRSQATESQKIYDDVKKAWIRFWKSANFEPLPPREMRVWLTRYERIIDRIEAQRSQELAVEQMQKQINESIDSICRMFKELEYDGRNDTESLADLIDRAQDGAERVDRAEQDRQRLLREQEALSNKITKTKRKVRDAQKNLAEWAEKWSKAVEPLGMSGNDSPSVVNVRLGQIDKLVSSRKNAHDLGTRIDLIDRDYEAFEQDVRLILNQVAPDLVGVSPKEATTALINRLQKARDDQNNFKTLESEKNGHQKDINEAEETIKEMSDLLSAICKEAGCENHSELPHIEKKSEQFLKLKEKFDATDDEILRLAGKDTVESFIAEAERVDADSLPSMIKNLNGQIQEIESQKNVLKETIGRKKSELESMGAGDEAAAAAEDVEDLLAKIEIDVQQYVRLQLATAVLRDGIERYRAKNQGPVLSRASELFGKLTLGAFASLRTDVDSQGKNVLVGERPEEKNLCVDSDGMSDGTRDQLYLALRLAGLENYLDQNEPLPFIVDDILGNFDNDRATATLKVLAALSDRTQVVFFTHHKHLVNLAENNIRDGRLFVHQL